MNILITGSNGQLGSEIKDLVTNYKNFNNNIDISGLEIKLTLKDDEFEKYKSIKFVRNLGRLNAHQMNIEYQKN